MTDEKDDSDGNDDDMDEMAAMYERDEIVGPGDAPSPSPETDEKSSEGAQDGTEPDQDDGGESQSASEPNLSAPKVEAGGGELEEITGTFYVKHAEEVAVTLHEVDTAQICTLVENPGFDRHEIVEATLKEQPPMGVSYLVEELESQYSVPVEKSSESLTTHVRGIGSEELDVGDAIAIEREGKGEIHILRVEPDQVADTVEELLDDEMTYKNAARNSEVSRVEIRADEELGVVSIRYMP